VLSCWRALADTEFGPGRLVDTPHAVAAVFPDFAYLNNAILTVDLESVAAAARSVAEVYADAGITTWALWVPNDAAGFDGHADRVHAVGSLARDVTTLVMDRVLDAGLRKDERVTTVSGSALRRLVLDEAVPAGDLGEAAAGARVTGWALVVDGQAVVTAYTHRNGTDCGVYAVGTLPGWRRRGLARALVEHILADAHEAGLRTATLQSTPMGLPLYRALGFRAIGRYEEWLHTPAADTNSRAAPDHGNRRSERDAG
jgi:GNAT superfamily N-acetyltransferase